MTISTHTYTAVIPGTVDRPINVSGGEVVIDESSSPHVQAFIRIPVPDADTLAALDVRSSPPPRVVVTATGTFPGYTQVRTFDLTVREVTVAHASGVADVLLTSDEALVMDAAPSVDQDLAAIASSLRDVVDYVLDTIGASLEATPSHDANVTPYWSVTNLVSNSSFEFDTAGWSNGSLATGLAPSTAAVFVGTKSGHWRTTGAGKSFIDSDRIRVTPGAYYTASVYLNHLGGASTTPRPGGILVRWFDARGTALRDEYSMPVTVTQFDWARAYMTVLAPTSAVEATIHPYFESNVADRFVAVDAVMFYEGRKVIEFFDGLTLDDDNYSYVYSDEILEQGTSTRVPVNERDPEALVWKAGQSGMDFLAPLVQSAGLRLVCDEGRNWTLRDETYVAPLSLDIRRGVNLIDGTNKLSRDDDTWFDAAVTVYTWVTRDDGKRFERMERYAPPGYTRLRRFERNTPFPGSGFSEYAVRRARGRGREVSATAVANWTAAAEQQVSIRLGDGSPVQIGRTSRVRFSLDRDEMSILTRSVDTPAGAIDLLEGPIDGLTGTIDEL